MPTRIFHIVAMLGMKSAEVAKRMREMDEVAERFNKHLMAVPQILIASGKLDGKALSRAVDTESAMGRVMRVNSHLILTTIMKMGILDRHHERIMGRDEQFFLSVDGQAQLKQWKTADSNVLSRNSEYYGEIIAAIQSAWPNIDEVVRERLWTHILGFYEAYLSYHEEN